MIEYGKGFFGFPILFRLHGSAVFRSILLSSISSFIYIMLLLYTDLLHDNYELMEHPYVMGVLVAALTFLLTFRANFSYNRYWDAFTSVHQMHSKWMDVGTDVAAFHLQSTKYDKVRPPAFGEHPDLTCLERERERLNEPTLSELELIIDKIIAEKEGIHASQRTLQQAAQAFNNKPNGKSFRRIVHSLIGRRGSRQGHDSQRDESRQDGSTQYGSIRAPSERNGRAGLSNIVEGSKENSSDPPDRGVETLSTFGMQEAQRDQSGRAAAPQVPDAKPHGVAGLFGGMFKGRQRRAESPPSPESESKGEPTNESELTGASTKVPVEIRTRPKHVKAWEENQPPLLLQEGAHLLSLLSAVAMSTLRNDLEGAGSPLIAFTPDAPWPHVDPDAYGADVRKDWTQSTHYWRTVMSFFFGLSRTPAHRTLYNAARPFRVVGGVSDAEIEVLKAARGPYAKVALCTMWMQEFICREHMNGGLGNIGAPIISRLFQFISDGMIGYNQARKVAFIPFPFPHAQITSLFVVVVCCLIPVMMLSFTNSAAFGFVLNLLTVMSFTGLHEVARELENPFQNVPNDAPLNNFQAQFNEGLMQMFAGYHPDAYWEIKQQVEDKSEEMDFHASYPPTDERLASIASGKKQNLSESKDEISDEHSQRVDATAASVSENTNAPTEV